MTDNVIICPLCKSEAKSQNDPALDGIVVTCPICDVFKITNDALVYLSEATPSERDGLIVKFDVFKEVYGKEPIPTILLDGKVFEVQHE